MKTRLIYYARYKCMNYVIFVLFSLNNMTSCSFGPRNGAQGINRIPPKLLNGIFEAAVFYFVGKPAIIRKKTRQHIQTFLDLKRKKQNITSVIDPYFDYETSTDDEEYCQQMFGGFEYSCSSDESNDSIGYWFDGKVKHIYKTAGMLPVIEKNSRIWTFSLMWQ